MLSTPRRPRAFVRARQLARRIRLRQAAAAAVVVLSGCALLDRAESPPGGEAAAAPDPAAAESVPPSPPESPIIDIDSLVTALAARADTIDVADRAGLESEIRDWLARLEFGDPELLTDDRERDSRFRFSRGRLLDALGWLAYRAGDLRAAEAALVSAVSQIHSRGRTEGYAGHFLHLGRVYAARRRWDDAIASFLAAEARGLGSSATPDLELAWQRRHGSLRGLDAAREAERSRIEDERRQSVVAGSLYQALPAFRWPRRTGPSMEARDLRGRPAVIALWDVECEGCAGYPAALAALEAALARRDATLVGVWLGGDPEGAGPPQRFSVLVPPDPADARRRFEADTLPLLAIVDARGLIRYRHAGRRAVDPSVGDILIQLDHLRRTGS